ncbi:MAG: FKBP-type peptidyl-prolyl cis-trans isomerase [Verrucomicrobia bacterium]|nr:FKBP-type peptidyl-prolyl cis-trans isomerase [Verrucomicrobiota bacterium]NDE63383.1 FKBP-type peptidyl-prolyl cis-trans isomerase [Chlamydiota bacterium]
MKKWLASLSIGCALQLLPLHGAEPVAAVQEESIDASKDIDHLLISEALGHLISKNLANLGPDFNMDRVIKGLKDAHSGKPTPLSEEQTVEAIHKIQEKSFQKLASENLREAQDFLDINSKKENVVSLESGKIQYVTLQKGEGPLVEATSNPLIKYQGKFLNGQVFGESEAGETISLSDTFPGFSKALVGMKEGEKRTIYIHPDLGYGTSGMLPPNSLLTFEVEIMKSHVPDDKVENADGIADTELLDQKDNIEEIK